LTNVKVSISQANILSAENQTIYDNFKILNQFLVINRLLQIHVDNYKDKLSIGLQASILIFSKKKIKNEISSPIIITTKIGIKFKKYRS